MEVDLAVVRLSVAVLSALCGGGTRLSARRFHPKRRSVTLRLVVLHTTTSLRHLFSLRGKFTVLLLLLRLISGRFGLCGLL